MVISREHTVISTFAGCGGSSLGYKWAGFKELLAIDFDKNAVESFRLNFDIPIWQRDIKEIGGKEILEFCNIKKGELDILDGSPPCQGFSAAGKQQVSDSRNDLFKEFVRLIKELQPKIFVMENVSGMIKGKMKGKFNEILNTLRGCKYSVKCKLMNAKYYEVPQSRERVIFIGIRDDINMEPVCPIPSRKIIRMRDINIQYIKNEIDEAYKTTPPYIKPYLEKMRDYEIASKYSLNDSYFNHKRNSINRPSRTILKVPGIYHHKENRLLTRSELKILGSFPIGFIINANLRIHYKLIGNSVPPKMMYHIAKTLKKEILEKL